MSAKEVLINFKCSRLLIHAIRYNNSTKYYHSSFFTDLGYKVSVSAGINFINGSIDIICTACTWDIVSLGVSIEANSIMYR